MSTAQWFFCRPANTPSLWVLPLMLPFTEVAGRSAYYANRKFWDHCFCQCFFFLFRGGRLLLYVRTSAASPQEDAASTTCRMNAVEWHIIERRTHLHTVRDDVFMRFFFFLRVMIFFLYPFSHSSCNAPSTWSPGGAWKGLANPIFLKKVASQSGDQIASIPEKDTAGHPCNMLTTQHRHNCATI